jgi:peroxiredoxin (alkyl hydroperoxide reductase subunit C)
MADEQIGCGRPTGGPVGQPEQPPKEESGPPPVEEHAMMKVQIGRKAPDFEAPAYVKGKFKNIKLSDHLGHWVVLCFYPGDFTFV